MDITLLPPALGTLLANARVKHIPRGQIVLYASDLPSEVYIVRQGVVELLNIDDDGEEKVLHLLSTSRVLPLAFYSGRDVPCRWYYTALVDCDLYVINRDELEQLMYGDARVGRFLTNIFSEEVHEVLTRLDSLSKSDVTEKLVAVLQYLSVVHGEKNGNTWRHVRFPINHQLLANMTGVSRESISIAMKKLVDKKIVRNAKPGQFDIDPQKLKAYRQRQA